MNYAATLCPDAADSSPQRGEGINRASGLFRFGRRDLASAVTSARILGQPYICGHGHGTGCIRDAFGHQAGEGSR
jgi:hypothetical protein